MIPYPFDMPVFPIINNWNDAVKIVDDLEIHFLKNLDKNTQYASTVYAVDSNKDAVTFKYALYYKQDDKWIENSSTFKVLKSEVPVQILEMLEKSSENKKVEVVDFFEEE